MLDNELEVYCSVFLLWTESWNSILVKHLSYIVAHILFDKNTKRVLVLFLWNLLSNWVMNYKSWQVFHKYLWKLILGLSTLLFSWFSKLVDPLTLLYPFHIVNIFIHLFARHCGSRHKRYSWWSWLRVINIQVSINPIELRFPFLPSIFVSSTHFRASIEAIEVWNFNFFFFVKWLIHVLRFPIFGFTVD